MKPARHAPGPITDPTRRFANRVENYVRYRPDYPKEIIPALAAECGLTADWTVADVGSGTGLLTELFLQHGNRVFGVEPNREMREAGERLLAGCSKFASVDGAAEATALPDASVNLVVAGQAFHWFDRAKCRAEFARILRPRGWVMLAWNDRRTGSTPFLAGYEQLLRDYATDYDQVNHKRIGETVVRDFFGAEPARKVFPNFQHFDYAALKGRLLSSSYAPEIGQPGHEAMLVALERLFTEHQQGGRVTFEYDTIVYFGQLA